MNRFKIKDIRATDDWSNSELLPTAAIFNIAYNTEWILGIHNDRNDEDDKQRIVIGYYEIIKLNLAAVNESYAMYQTFEVNLSTPGKGLMDIHSQEPEGMMNESLHHLTAAENGIIPQGIERE